MVAGIVIGVAILAGIFLFQGEIKAIADRFAKTDAQRKKEKKEEEEFKRKGAIGSAKTFIFGTEFLDKIKDASFREKARKEKEKQAKQSGFKSVEEFERQTDANRNPFKFNPSNTIGFGIKSLNQGRGIPDTKENREIVKQLLQVTQKPKALVDVPISQKRKTGKKRSVFR